jgi:hypothetical protein
VDCERWDANIASLLKTSLGCAWAAPVRYSGSDNCVRHEEVQPGLREALQVSHTPPVRYGWRRRNSPSPSLVSLVSAITSPVIAPSPL